MIILQHFTIWRLSMNIEINWQICTFQTHKPRASLSVLLSQLLIGRKLLPGCDWLSKILNNLVCIVVCACYQSGYLIFWLAEKLIPSCDWLSKILNCLMRIVVFTLLRTVLHVNEMKYPLSRQVGSTYQWYACASWGNILWHYNRDHYFLIVSQSRLYSRIDWIDLQYNEL